MTFVQKGKKKREELRLPVLHFIVADDWLDKLDKSFNIWLKLHTWVDRTDAERDYDVIPTDLGRLMERLNVSKSKFYRLIKPLWEYGLIDIIEYDQSKRNSQKPKNIVVYEYPFHERERQYIPLEKLRDWEKDYESVSKQAGMLGGRPKKDGFKNETVDGFKNETVTVSEMKHNNYTNNSNNLTNNYNNYTNTTNTQDKKISSSSSREIIDNELKEKYPDKPFEEIKNQVLSDETLTIKTDKQYRGALEYRLKNWKEKIHKPITRKEMVPDFAKDGYSYVEPEYDEAFEKEKRKLEEELKQLDQELKLRN